MREGTSWHGDMGTRGAHERPGGSEAWLIRIQASIEYGVSSIGRGIETGDGHGHREFRNRPFGHRELAPGFRRLKAEGLTPERLTPVAVTRHLE